MYNNTIQPINMAENEFEINQAFIRKGIDMSMVSAENLEATSRPVSSPTPLRLLKPPQSNSTAYGAASTAPAAAAASTAPTPSNSLCLRSCLYQSIINGL